MKTTTANRVLEVLKKAFNLAEDWEWRSEGPDAPEATDIAVGAIKFPLMADKEKVELLRSILQCEPVEDDLRSALVEAGLNEKICQVVWHAVEVDGWDASLERAKDKGRSLKSQWDIIAGETYGEKKAASWFPVGWDNDLEGVSAESLETEVTIARADLDDKIANQALSDYPWVIRPANGLPYLI